MADILRDPEASENDRYVALQFLRNSEITRKGDFTDLPKHRCGDYRWQEKPACLNWRR
ncbi:hypothetical protein M5G07_01400 [Serratia symbiotica]|nr:hypothetical protein [Serratia symbiotica]